MPIEILYDRMKTAVTGEDDQGHIAYNRSLLALALVTCYRGCSMTPRIPCGALGENGTFSG